MPRVYHVVPISISETLHSQERELVEEDECNIDPNYCLCRVSQLDKTLSSVAIAAEGHGSSPAVLSGAVLVCLRAHLFATLNNSV